MSEEDSTCRETVLQLRDEARGAVHEFVESSTTTSQQHAMSSVRAVVQRFRMIASYFHNSPKGKSALQLIQARTSSRQLLGTVVDCPTRWSSTWAMCDRLIGLEDHVEAFFVYLSSSEGSREFPRLGSKLVLPSPEDWFAMKCLYALLQPFAAVTSLLSGQAYPTLALVCPCLRSIELRPDSLDIFDQVATDAGRHTFVPRVLSLLHQARVILLKLFRERFQRMPTELLWESYFDPRLVRMPRMNLIEVEEARERVVDAMVVEVARADVREALQRERPRQAFFSPPRAESDLYSDVFGDEDDPDEFQLETPASINRLRVACTAEFFKYIDMASTVNRRRTNPLQWWREYGHRFPTRRRLARKWLGCVASTVPSEQVFSTGGNVVSAKRCALAGSIVRDLVFVAHNYK